MDLISIIVPCYNEQEALPDFYKEIVKIAKTMKYVNFEFIFVDDGSKDETLSIMKKLHEKDKRVRFVSFSRNFGKEAGMLAGLRSAKGDYVAVMDVDLQDPPSLLPEMYETVKSGEYDCAATRRTTRKGEPPIRSFFARMFYKIINKMSDAEIVDGARDFRLMRRRMVDAILSMGEYNRFSKGIFGWVGFKTKWLEYVNIERVAGETKWSFWKLFKYSMEGIMAFTTTPLYISSIMGFVVCIITFILACFYAIKALVFGDPAAGFPTIVCIMLFLGGIQLIGIGVVGMYLSKTYLETKQRPIYIVKETDEDGGD
ncbi:MAG: glycosyltransferase family 2 protein [Clostridia bacterium]|nr:glycosyltransferase family 2 protein [Clostridia bacterium]